MHERDITIRTATPQDDAALRRLTRVSSRRSLTGPLLIADHRSVPVAAVAIRSGAALADPLEPTADAVSALRLRRYEIVRQGGRVAPAWTLPRHPAPGPAGREARPPHAGHVRRPVTPRARRVSRRTIVAGPARPN